MPGQGLMAAEPLDPAVPAAALNFLVSYFLSLPPGSFCFVFFFSKMRSSCSVTCP